MRSLILLLVALLALNGVAAAAARDLHHGPTITTAKETSCASHREHSDQDDHGPESHSACSCFFCSSFVVSAPPRLILPRTSRLTFVYCAQARHVPPYPALIEYPPEAA